MPRFQRNRASITALALTATALLPGCASTTPSETGDSVSGPVLVAESPDRQWTGVAWIGSSGEVIVNYPRWTEEYTNAVERVRIGPDGAVTRVPWPNQTMNTVPDPESLSPSERRDVLVAVQAVHTDRKGRIWILDTGNPGFAGVLEGGAKLIMVNPSTGRVERTYAFDSTIARPDSYLNDVRIDIRYERAYITDSGIGGLVVVDLDTAEARRVLDGHPSTLAEPDFTPVIGGRAFVDPQTGQPPQIHADGIALSPDGRHLYWQALTAKTLYRVPTRALADFTVENDALIAEIENMGRTVVTDGMAFDGRGNLYFSALENDAVMYRTPTGAIRTLWSSPKLAWPDTFSYDAVRDVLYVTTAQIHRMPGRAGPGMPWPPAEPFRIFRFDLSGAN
ncbi:MAG: major royal jelly family protein [bacterium]|nr:major royal jelly family protein [bacterium]